jgi:hypothetical protein
MPALFLTAALIVALGQAPAVEAACQECSSQAKRKAPPPRHLARGQFRPVLRPPLRPYDGDQGGSYRPSFGCNVMGCD